MTLFELTVVNNWYIIMVRSVTKGGSRGRGHSRVGAVEGMAEGVGHSLSAPHLRRVSPLRRPTGVVSTS